MNLKDKTVVITGAGGGIGASMAHGFASKGANIVLSDIRPENMEKVAAELRGMGVQAHCVVGDIAKEASAEQLMAEAVSKTGRLDVAVLNAGILRDGLLVRVDKETGKVKGKLSLEQWQSVIDVNLTGVFLTGREAAVQMIETKSHGAIITIASVSMHGNPGQTNYSAAKAGVASMTKLWAQELSRYRIRVAGIAPGFIKTDMIMKDMKADALAKWEAMIPIGRLGEPREIADSVIFIAENDLVNGVILEISGGVKV
ncbi:MAG: SDR family NAD(P)-dependent oxidoreductase [Spirochaetia bacterium]|nr:SDR family NAD(P)-dependent oxidoreductase [Spirochaetia bacterium]